MLETFLDAYPKLGVPAQITWYPTAESVASYSIDFSRPVHDDDVKVVRQFVTQHANITGAARHPRLRNGIIVTCRHGDTDRSLLLWLQQRFQPYRPYTGMVHVYSLVRPLMARISIMGIKPENYGRLVKAISTLQEATRTAYLDGTNQILVVVGDASPDADPFEAVEFLTAQRLIGVTFMIDRETTAVDFPEPPQSE